MLNRVIFGDDILIQAKSLVIKALYIKWKTLSQLKRLTLTDFFDGDEKVSGNCLIMLHTSGDDYAVVYHGAVHRAAVGHDLSGQLISETNTRLGRELRPIYHQVRETGLPARLIYAAEGTSFAAGWERIIVPLKIAGEVRMLVSYAEPLTLVRDVHEFLFDNSPHIVIVALPVYIGEHAIADADIVQMNPAASRFFNIDPGSDFPIRLRQLKPWFDDDATWEALTTRHEQAWETTLSGPRSGQAFKCLLVKLEYLLVLRIYLIEASELVEVD
jgi:PAS domain-containing protein